MYDKIKYETETGEPRKCGKEKRKMKKIRLIAVGMALVLVLTACGRAPAEESSSERTESQTQSREESSSRPESSSEASADSRQEETESDSSAEESQSNSETSASEEGEEQSSNDSSKEKEESGQGGSGIEMNVPIEPEETYKMAKIVESGLVSGNYEYDVLEDGCACLTDYFGSEANVTVPSEIEGHKVTVLWGTFYGDESIVTVTIPDTVEMVHSPFNWLINLKSVTWPSSIQSADGVSPIYFCSYLEEVKMAENPYFELRGEVIYDLNGTRLLSIIPGMLRGVTSYTIPEGVLYIAHGGFAYALDVVSITLPQSLVSIGYDGFMACCALESIVFPENLRKIGAGAFSYCENLHSIGAFPPSLTTLGQLAFAYTPIESITIPDSLEEMDITAFQGCEKLREIHVSDTHPTLHVQDGVLYNKDMTKLICVPTLLGLTSLTVPDTVKVIGSYACFNCQTLQEVTLPEGLLEIGSMAFGHCTGIHHLTLPSTLQFLDESNGMGASTFTFCSGLEEIVIPEGITYLPICCFQECQSLKSVTLPSTLEIINYRSFFICTSLTEITIPESVKCIGEEAFHRCDSLTTVYITSSETVLEGEGIFEECPNVTVVAPAGSPAEKYCIDHGIRYRNP